jgi:hypothetical protein
VNWQAVIWAGVVTLVLAVFFWLNDKYLIPWRAKRYVDRIMTDIKAGKRPDRERKFNGEIHFDDNGFEAVPVRRQSLSAVTMRWDEVQKAVAFKLDLFTTDEIRILLAREDGSGCELSEDMKGWTEFVESLPKHLPGCQRLDEWIWKVASPAFETNTTEIFTRESTRLASV